MTRTHISLTMDDSKALCATMHTARRKSSDCVPPERHRCRLTQRS